MSSNSPQRLSTATLLKAGGAGILAAVLANIVTRFLLGALLPLSPDFPPHGLASILIFTIVFCGIGVIVLAVVNRVASQPLKVYNILAIVALFLSIVPNLAGAANPSAMPMGGASTDYLVLIIFHFVAAAAYLVTLNAVARKG